MALTRSQAQAYYDRFGAKQDAQAFYEDAALDDLVAHAEFERAEKVFELGCGTGRFASRLLAGHMPASATYLGVDLSRIMIELAGRRLSSYGGRAKVMQTDGAMQFPLPDRAVDRVVSTYVLDLLSETDIRRAIAEVRRVLAPGGKLCLASLTHGVTVASRIVSALWSGAFRVHAPLVGGCRPIRLDTFLDRRTWSVDYHHVVTPFGVPSEVLIATVKSTPNAPSSPDAPMRRSG